MNTEKLELSSGSYDDKIGRAAKILQEDGIVAIPTETVYGLAASAYSEAAIKKVFHAKGRPQDNPLIVHVSDMEMLSKVVSEIPQKASLCARKFWPGPFTMVLKRADSIPASVSAGLDTVAVRMPSDPVAQEIIKVSGLPLAAPSANVSGAPSPTCAAHVLEDLDGKIDGIVVAGECGVGVESTVVSFCCEPPRLLRPGGVTAEQLKEILPDLVIDPAVLAPPEKDKAVASPGMKYKHYAPKTETFLVVGDSDSFAEYVNEKQNCAAICFLEDSNKIKVKKIIYGSTTDESTLAHNVFSVLRDVDKLGVATVYVHAPSRSGVGLAVYNRLIRAAAFRVITL